jgi:hypothetical protein
MTMSKMRMKPLMQHAVVGYEVVLSLSTSRCKLMARYHELQVTYLYACSVLGNKTASRPTDVIIAQSL